MILEIDGVELSYAEKSILRGIHLKSESGKVTGILGRNGSGKTSLLKVIFGSISPRIKSIRIDGANQSKSLYRTGDIAFLPQNELLPKNLSLSKAFGLFKVDWEFFVKTFSSFSKYQNQKLVKLSSGERRVIETYLIIKSRKKIILLDEPFSFIAPIYVEKFKEILLKDNDSAIIITDHFYRDILDISNEVYLLKSGFSKVVNSKEKLEQEGYLLVNNKTGAQSNN